ncbi:sialate O-acetylesterase [Marinilabilia rubra]|uniref:Glycosyl hydrolase family 2 n=1 Tax=Marinilabilia rubra TaxID=2162893 RepID=A0A2U2B6D4_9BACT|nr:sialate O-acetylesterase [Marinilabilia rubra]PWD98602.1 glycosyl hydrolase family 2 [Marinilabilia rubra]
MKLTLSYKLFALFFMAAFLFNGCKQKSKIEVPSIFSDNLVLQQNTDVTMWGKATPGTTVNAKGDWGETASTEAGKDSLWQLNLPTSKAGGPYKLILSTADSTIQINNVMLGEVWLASGQSNMEMPLTGWPPNDTILNSAATIAESENPDIRMFTVSRNMAAEPMSDVSGFWAIASPQTSGRFSATAYHFAKKINKELDIPVGIIHSSWGGTPIESWISNKTLASSKDFEDITKNLKNLAPEIKAYDQWLGKLQHVSILSSEEKPNPFENLDLFDDYCSAPETSTQDWPVMFLPTTFEQSDIGEFDGAAWFRKEIMIPESWEDKDLILSLGPIDDMDVAYFNGKKIGGTEVAGFWQKVRYYTVPASEVKAGPASLAVKVIDTQGGGGIYGDSEQLKIYPEGNKNQSIDLKGKWHYKVVAQITGDQLYLFNPETNVYDTRPELSMALNSHTPTVLYNAMIAPLTSFTIKGSIWYQGETNVGRASQYIELMDLLISDWRKQFNNPEMPFYFVQLAPWNYDNIEGRSSAWLREAQRRSMEITNAGMAVTLDIGNVDNIHPANKEDVGKRLALWALAKNYEKKDLVYSGPFPQKTEQSNGKIVISFSHAENGLKLKSGVKNQFEIAGKDGNFVPAKVKINGNTIEVYSPKVSQPANVRYGFKNGAEASLFNKSGLPAPSFSTEEEINQ